MDMNFQRKASSLRRFAQIAMIGLGGVIVFEAAAVPRGYVDPLDTPAQMVANFSQEAKQSIALAGKRLVAVGEWGSITVSDDNGRSWRQVASPVSSNLLSVFFLNEKMGWIVGQDGVVLQTRDGGTSWAKKFDGRQAAEAMLKVYGDRATYNAAAVSEARNSVTENGPAYPFLSTWFHSEKTGYVVGPYNFIFRTDDGGETWVPQFHKVDNPNGYHLNAIAGVGKDIYLAGEKGLVEKYDPVKDVFINVSPNYAGSFFGILGKESYVIAFGLRGTVFRSADHGKTWKKIPVADSSSITSGTVLDDGRVVLGTLAGNLWVSADEGRSFTRLATDAQLPKFGVAPAGDGKSLAAVGPRGSIVIPIK